MRNTITPQKLRAKDVAKRYGVGLSTVWLFAKQNKLKAYKVSDRVTVFDVAECDKFFSNTAKI